MSTISERLGISNEIHELKFGKSFTNASNSSKFNSSKNSFNNNNDNGNTESFHTIRYDFKPVSVDTSQTASIEFNEKNKITVTAPNVEGSGMSCTVFQGSRKPHLKECVLVFDHDTGDFTLERLTNNIVVKKTRAEGSSKIVNQQRPITPAGLNSLKSVSPKLSNNNQLNGSTRSPPTNSSSANLNSANNINGTSSHRSPKDKLTATSSSSTTSQPNALNSLNSMPIFNSSTLNSVAASNNIATGNSLTKNIFNDYNKVAALSSSSSSSSSDDDSSSSSSSSSSSEDEDDEPEKQTHLTPATINSKPAIISNKQMNISASSSDEMDSDDEKLSSLNNNLINSLNNGLSNVGISNNGPIGFSMPKLSDLNDDLQLSESGSDSE